MIGGASGKGKNKYYQKGEMQRKYKQIPIIKQKRSEHIKACQKSIGYIVVVVSRGWRGFKEYATNRFPPKQDVRQNQDINILTPRPTF